MSAEKPQQKPEWIDEIPVPYNDKIVSWGQVNYSNLFEDKIPGDSYYAIVKRPEREGDGDTMLYIDGNIVLRVDQHRQDKVDRALVAIRQTKKVPKDKQELEAIIHEAQTNTAEQNETKRQKAAIDEVFGDLQGAERSKLHEVLKSVGREDLLNG